ncbi:MAG: DUF998 domain-containing protein [Thermoprotei archaeon]
MEYGKIAGSMIFAGVTQFLILLIVAESIYPNYSVHYNYISDLGVGVTAPIFNTSVFLLGALIVISSVFVYAQFKNKPFTTTILLSGVGASGVGVFPETSGAIHSYMALITFLFSGVSAIISAGVLRQPTLRVYSVILGVLTLASLFLYASGHYYDLGRGGMERLIVYPSLIWALGFSASLIGSTYSTT